MATVSEAFIVRQAIITAIVRDGSCTPSNAGNVLKSIEYIIAMIREMGYQPCLLYTSPSPRDRTRSRMPSSA